MVDPFTTTVAVIITLVFWPALGYRRYIRSNKHG